MKEKRERERGGERGREREREREINETKERNDREGRRADGRMASFCCLLRLRAPSTK